MDFPTDSIRFLRDLTSEVVDASRIHPGQRVGDSPANSVGFTLIRPGGRACYPSFWIRDFSMSLESGCVTADEMHDHLILTARCQNGASPRRLKSGGIVPAFAIPDHINFDGKPVYYPGTYSSGEDQGGEPWGILPPVDDHYEFMHIAHELYRTTGRADFLNDTVDGMTLFRRLFAAFDSPATDQVTGMVITDDAHRAVGFGFCDAIYFTGALLFPSLLRYRAAGELAVLAGTQQSARGRVDELEQIQRRIAGNLTKTFADPSRVGGWLMAATGIGRQADVWGTLYALHLDVLRGDDAERATDTIVDAVRRGAIDCEAAVRHVPTDLDASPTSAWEKTSLPKGSYQNGAYWHTATGWLIAAVRRRDRTMARQIFDRYVQHLRDNDFRKGSAFGAPWECFGRNGQARQNAVYMASVTVPWSIIRGLHNGE